MIRAGVDPGLLTRLAGGGPTTCGCGRLTRLSCMSASRPTHRCRHRRDLRASGASPRLRSRLAELSTERRRARTECPPDPHQSRRSVIQRLQVRPHAEELRPIRAPTKSDAKQGHRMSRSLPASSRTSTREPGSATGSPFSVCRPTLQAGLRGQTTVRPAMRSSSSVTSSRRSGSRCPYRSSTVTTLR